MAHPPNLFKLGLLVPLLSAGTAPAATLAARDAQIASPRTTALLPYAAHVREAAARFGLSEALIRAVMAAESGGDAHALSSAGAMGLMQIMPATWRELAARHDLGGDPFDIRANVLAGAAYLRAMLDRYGDLGTALAAYNAGPARVDDWRSGARALPSETVAYVARIAPAASVRGERPSVRAAVIPPDWRSARLFTARMEGASDRAAATANAQPARIATISTVPRPSFPNGSNPLFIPLSGQVAR